MTIGMNANSGRRGACAKETIKGVPHSCCKLQLKLAALLAVCVCGSASLSAQDVTVYDNLPGTELGRFAALDWLGRPTEFGDEIALGGTARIVTKFIFDYYGDFTPSGDETARVRFYANDAPGIYLKPGTVLYDSGPFPIIAGPARVTLEIPFVEVPNTFTWTVSFGGLQQVPGDAAELIIHNPPAIGRTLAPGVVGSYRDYWKYNAGTWSLYMLTNGLPANFAAKVIARDETITLSLRLDRDAGLLTFRWSGKANVKYQIESSPDLQNWMPLEVVEATKDGYVDFSTPVNPDEPMLFYRLSKLFLPPPQPVMSIQKGKNPGEISIRWVGGRDMIHQIKYSADLKTWEYLASVRTDADGKAEYIDKPPARAATRFYRVWTPW